jgi:hypothetical protein
MRQVLHELESERSENRTEAIPFNLAPKMGSYLPFANQAQRLGRNFRRLSTDSHKRISLRVNNW